MSVLLNIDSNFLAPQQLRFMVIFFLRAQKQFSPLCSLFIYLTWTTIRIKLFWQSYYSDANDIPHVIYEMLTSLESQFALGTVEIILHLMEISGNTSLFI